MCDSVRSSLAEKQALGPDALKLQRFLDNVLRDEVHNAEGILDYDLIVNTCLDKLLDDLVDPFKRPSGPMNAIHVGALSAATSLQKQWRNRFREKYFEMDDVRKVNMLKSGRLRDISFHAAPDTGIVEWKAKKPDNEKDPALNIQFDPGQWVVIQRI